MRTVGTSCRPSIGLLDPDQVIAPYDCTLNNMSAQERREWATRVQQQLRECLPPGAEVIILAGTRYREGIEPFLSDQRASRSAYRSKDSASGSSFNN